MADSDLRPAFIVYNSGGPFDIIPPSAKLVLGRYAEAGWNHGKRVYRRVPTEEQKFLPEVCLFFWDESDGQDLAGWWFGDKVGGGQVWSRNLCLSPLPPMKGWQFPADGPVQDHIVCVPPVIPPKPFLRVKVEEPDAAPQAQPSRPKRRWGGAESSAAPLAKQPKAETEVAEALVLASALGRDAPWGTQHLLGEYVPVGQNHGRRAYCRRRGLQTPDEKPIWLYYWDFRDGPNASGWWLGRRIGGKERFGRAATHAVTPPLTGWRVPPEGAERQDLSFVPQGQPEEAPMTEEKRLAAATATVERAEGEAYKALEASQSAIDSGSPAAEATLRSAIDLLKESAVAVEAALASMGRHERAARSEPGKAHEELGHLQERLQVLLESVQQEISSATWRLEGPLGPPQPLGIGGGALPALPSRSPAG